MFLVIVEFGGDPTSKMSKIRTQDEEYPGGIIVHGGIRIRLFEFMLRIILVVLYYK